MILVCGSLADPLIELVCARLADCGYPYRLLHLGLYPAGFEVCWSWNGARPEGHIAADGWSLDLTEITGVYVRYPGPEGRAPAPETPPELAAAVYAECDTCLAALFEKLPCCVVNRLAGGMSNHSKPHQALLVRRSGLLVPPTLVSNDPEAVLQFVEECAGAVIYKSLSGVRSIVRQLGAKQLERLPYLCHGPAQFQRFIPGENIRVHTVGREIFATRVRCEAVDYRYGPRDGQRVDMETTTLPPSVAAACRWLAAVLDLELAGIDLKETPEGEYYCFEINPSPAFLYYERTTGQPISTALASLLHKGYGRRRRGRCGLERDSQSTLQKGERDGQGAEGTVRVFRGSPTGGDRP